MNRLIVTLPLPDRRLHAHATGHWTKKKGPTKALRNEACLLATVEMRGRRVKWEKAAVTYRFFFKENRARDASNCIQSMKPAIDGVVDAGLIPDDRWQVLQIAGVECGIDRDNPRTELVFERVE